MTTEPICEAGLPEATGPEASPCSAKPLFGLFVDPRGFFDGPVDLGSTPCALPPTAPFDPYAEAWADEARLRFVPGFQSAS